VLVVGAGVTGIYQLHRAREAGFSTLLLEAGGGVGGTWFWNRYPGARFDSESWTYGYSFSKELLEEWEWEEHFSAQPHTERYLNYVADKFDLRRDIQFNSRVAAAHWRERSKAAGAPVYGRIVNTSSEAFLAGSEMHGLQAGRARLSPLQDHGRSP